MRSIIYAYKDPVSDKRCLCFTAIAYGNYDDTSNFVYTAQKELKLHFCQESICLYSDTMLNQAEFHPERMKGNASFQFRDVPNKELNQTYFGFFVDKSKQLEVHRYWFKKHPKNIGDWLIAFRRNQRPINYNKQTLQHLLDTRLGGQVIHTDEWPIFSDIEIHFNSWQVIRNERAVRLVCFISGFSLDYVLDDEITWFKQLIAQFDLDCPSCFRSAYISYGISDAPIVQEFLQNQPGFSVEQYNKYDYLLGCEWCWYLSNTITQHYSSNWQGAIAELAIIDQLKNGICCTANGTIDTFSRTTRQVMQTIMFELLSPGYGSFSWRNFYNFPWRLATAVQRVCVYKTQDDYQLVFPFRYHIDQIDDNFDVISKNLISVIDLD